MPAILYVRIKLFKITEYVISDKMLTGSDVFMNHVFSIYHIMLAFTLSLFTYTFTVCKASFEVKYQVHEIDTHCFDAVANSGVAGCLLACITFWYQMYLRVTFS